MRGGEEKDNLSRVQACMQIFYHRSYQLASIVNNLFDFHSHNTLSKEVLVLRSELITIYNVHD